MYCGKCGNKVKENEKFCGKCGNYIGGNNVNNAGNNYRPNNVNNAKYYNTSKSKGTFISILIVVLSIFIVFVMFGIVIVGAIIGKSIYSWNEDGDNGDIISSVINNKKTLKKGKTAINTEKTYRGLDIKSIEEAKKIIQKDSEEQKEGTTSDEIQKIEKDIISKYKITAVNLGEIDVEFAKELQGVLEELYREYPECQKYLSNLSISNYSPQNGTIAYFQPIFPFTSEKTFTTRPWTIKTRISLASEYFLNEKKLENAVKVSSAAGHFPPNSTKYSPLAHEFGHYISFIALLKEYDVDSITYISTNEEYRTLMELNKDMVEGKFTLKMLKEAYNDYIKDTGNTISFDDWRGTISKYALAKDENGKYIYDETIAEAFHDVYLNGSNAKTASKYIIRTLKEKIRR